MPRRTFPCDVRAATNRQAERQSREIPFCNVERLLPSVELDTLPFDFDKLMAAVAEIHPRATSWIKARLEGLTDVETAEQWGVTPQYVMRWRYAYELKIKAVFAEFLEVRMDLSTETLCETHRQLMVA